MSAVRQSIRRHPVRTIALAAFTGAALGSLAGFKTVTKPIPWPNREGK